MSRPPPCRQWRLGGKPSSATIVFLGYFTFFHCLAASSSSSSSSTLLDSSSSSQLVPSTSNLNSNLAQEQHYEIPLTARRDTLHLQRSQKTKAMINDDSVFQVSRRQIAKQSRDADSDSSDIGSMPVHRSVVLSKRHMSGPSEDEHATTTATTTIAGQTISNQQRIHQNQEAALQRKLAEFKQKYMVNRAISDKAYYALLFVYSTLILVGSISNSLICLTVILKPRIVSPRNVFIFNLAGSDLLLCVFTMPFSFIEISMKLWQMGAIPCKLVAGLQATSIFVSTISITAIALDRYKVIVYPTHQETASGARGGALLLAAVWLGALLLSVPLFWFRTVEHLDLRFKSEPNFKSIDICVEAWPFNHGRGIYSVISMIFQYVLPITIVSIVYAKISDKLQKRLIRRQRLTQLECQQKRQLNLIRRTHTMLVSVSLIFGLSWLPLNLLNVIADFTDLFRGDNQLFRTIFGVCHLIGCSSACTNPILYGYLNENFRKEMYTVYSHHGRQLLRLFRRVCIPRCCPYLLRSTIYLPPTPSSSSINVNVVNNQLQQVIVPIPCDEDESDSDEGEFTSDEDESYSDDANLRPPANACGRSTSAPLATPADTCVLNIAASNYGLVRSCTNIATTCDNGKLQLASAAATNKQSPSCRKLSLSARTGGTLGRTTRFCLCISGSSSSSVEDINSAQHRKPGTTTKRKKKRRRRKNENKQNGNNNNNNNNNSTTKQHEKSSHGPSNWHLIEMQALDCKQAAAASGNKTKATGRCKPTRMVHQQTASFECDCLCHKQTTVDSNRRASLAQKSISAGQRVRLRFWPTNTLGDCLRTLPPKQTAPATTLSAAHCDNCRHSSSSLLKKSSTGAPSAAATAASSGRRKRRRRKSTGEDLGAKSSAHSKRQNSNDKSSSTNKNGPTVLVERIEMDKGALVQDRASYYLTVDNLTNKSQLSLNDKERSTSLIVLDTSNEQRASPAYIQIQPADTQKESQVDDKKTTNGDGDDDDDAIDQPAPSGKVATDCSWACHSTRHSSVSLTSTSSCTCSSSGSFCPFDELQHEKMAPTSQGVAQVPQQTVVVAGLTKQLEGDVPEITKQATINKQDKATNNVATIATATNSCTGTSSLSELTTGTACSSSSASASLSSSVSSSAMFAENVAAKDAATEPGAPAPDKQQSAGNQLQCNGFSASPAKTGV